MQARYPKGDSGYPDCEFMRRGIIVMAAAGLGETLLWLLDTAHVHNESRVILMNFLVLRTERWRLMEWFMTLDYLSSLFEQAE